MTKLYPSIVIGLGESGSEIVAQIHELLASSQQPELTALTRTLILTARGLHGLPVASAEGADTGGVDLRLATDVQPGVWAANYEVLLGQGSSLRHRLERAVYEVRSFTRGTGVERRSIELGNDVTFYLIGSLGDPVGSAALVPMLALIHEMFNQTFRGMHARTQLVLLSHDLLPDGPSSPSLLKARAYAALQELEWVFDGGLRLPYAVLSDLVWLLSSRNEENLFLGGHAQLVPVIAHQMLTMLRGEVLGDPSSVRTALVDRVMERSTRYSTFGFSQLVFPRELLLTRATDALAARTLSENPALAERRIGAGELSGEVERYVYGEGLNEVFAALGRDDSGNEIWAGYNPGRRVLEEENAQTLLHQLDAYDREFEQREAPEIQRRIGRRRTTLLATQQDRILSYLTTQIVEQRERGTLVEAEAWLAALLNEKCEWVDGEVALGTETLYVVDRDLDRYFEPLLFGGDENDSAEYVTRVSIANGRRLLLQQVKRQLDESIAVLLQSKDRQQARRQELEAADAAASKNAASDSRAAGVQQALSHAPGAEAGDRSAAVTQTIVTRAELESDEHYIARLEQEIGALTPVYARVHGEVTRLDHTIQTASERRRIFLTRLAEMQKVASERRESYEQAEKGHRARRAELAELADNRRRWLWNLIGVWAVALIGAAGLLIRYPALRELPGWSYAGLLLAGAVFSAWRYWDRIGRRYREMKEQTAAAMLQKNTRRDQLVQAHVQVRREIYEYDRYDALVDWRTELTDFVRALRHEIRSFREALLQLARDTAESAKRLDLPDSPFLEYLLPEGGVPGLLHRTAEEIGMQMRDMWREKPVSAVFAEFRSATGENRLAGLMQRIRGHAEAVFEEFSGLTAEQFFAQTVASHTDRRARIARLYRNAAPFAKRITEEGGETAVRLAYVGLTDPLEQSVVRSSLDNVEQARFYQAQVDTEVSMLRLAMAFPAFQFAPMEEARSHLEGLDAEQRTQVYLDPLWLTQVRDLKPSVLRLGAADDEFRQLACLAVAYGSAEQVQTADGALIRYSGADFPNYETWVLHLGSLAGARDRRSVEEELRTIRGRGTTQVRVPQEVLRSYRDTHPTLDPVDREIIDLEIGSYEAVNSAGEGGDFN
jgi:hypothetical protein